jgi:hypothetical protein
MSNVPFESFIHQTYIDDLDLCDEIIEAYTISPLKYEGSFGMGFNDSVIDKTRKDTTEITLDACPELYVRYAKQLQKCLNLYIEKYITCDWHHPFNVVEKINIQHYKPGASFSVWHTERNGPKSDRHLVFMTYLNDVTDQGGTEFYNQKLITEPKKGLTLIWPADWTHTHRGIASPTQHKYIVTGWFNYVERKK